MGTDCDLQEDMAGQRAWRMAFWSSLATERMMAGDVESLRDIAAIPDGLRASGGILDRGRSLGESERLASRTKEAIRLEGRLVA